MKNEIRVTRNIEFQKVEFRIPKNIGFKLKLYGKDIDKTENSIVNEMLEEFTNEIDFRTMLYNSAISSHYYREKVLLIFPIEELGFDLDGNRSTMKKEIMVEGILTNLGKALSKYGRQKELDLQYPVSYSYNFRAEQEITIAEYDSQRGYTKIEKKYLSGVF
ncbi:MAG: hypothetical protein ACRCZ2_04175, partial [Fusobacteriaceae bacterium]